MSASDEEDDAAPQLVDLPGISAGEMQKASFAASSSSRTPIPVTILTGFLGSGKTTLLNYLLTENHGKRIAIIENEFSEGLGIEKMIAKSGVDGSNFSEGFFELNNGCICCTVKSDLLNTLEQLVLHKHKFDYVIIETTGVSNPGPIVSTFWVDKELESSLYIDGVVCVVDSLNILSYLVAEETSNDVKVQICYADRVLMNKADLVTDECLLQVEGEIRSINSICQIVSTNYSKIRPDLVLDINSFNMEDVLDVKLDHINNNNLSNGMTGVLCEPVNSRSRHAADALMTQSVEFDGEVDLPSVRRFLDKILYANASKSPHGGGGGMQIYRMKGALLVEGSAQVHVLQAVHDIFDVQPSSHARSSPADCTEGRNRVIMIGKSLDAAAMLDGLRACVVGRL